MKYTATITVFSGDNSSGLFKVLQPELENSKRDRSLFSIKKKKDSVEIHISAQDSVALRATQNNITKLLTVYEKLQEGN